MFSYKKVTIALVSLTVIVAISAYAIVQYDSTVYKTKAAICYDIALELHKELMKCGGYATASLGNRVIWVKEILVPVMDDIIKDLSPRLQDAIRTYVIDALIKICNNEEVI